MAACIHPPAPHSRAQVTAYHLPSAGRFKKWLTQGNQYLRGCSFTFAFFGQLVKLASRNQNPNSGSCLLKFWSLCGGGLAYILSLYLCLCCIISATKCILTDDRWAQCTGGSPNWMYHQLTSNSCLNISFWPQLKKLWWICVAWQNECPSTN